MSLPGVQRLVYVKGSGGGCGKLTKYMASRLFLEQ